MQLKAAVGVETIRAHEDDYLRRALAAWLRHPNIEILGNATAERLSIVSFTVRTPNGKYLHHNAVVAILNDLFGIQSRGGCSCAGPYGHALLGVDIERSREFEREVSRGCEGSNRDGRESTSTTSSPKPCSTTSSARLRWSPATGGEFSTTTTSTQVTGLWTHKARDVAEPMHLGDVRYDENGELNYPHHERRADESVLREQLASAEARWRPAGSAAARTDRRRSRAPWRGSDRVRGTALVRPASSEHPPAASR